MTRHNALGADAEVDFGDVYVDVAGRRTRCYLFAFRLAYSGKAVHRISRSCGQQAFFEGHVHALTTLGGVPAGQVRYDNLTPAVKKVVFRSRSREDNPRWTAFHDRPRARAKPSAWGRDQAGQLSVVHRRAGAAGDGTQARVGTVAHPDGGERTRCRRSCPAYCCW